MELVVVIAGMTAVTYVPRLLPLLGSARSRLTPWQRRAMGLVPITAIGALIVPGGLTAVNGSVGLSTVGLVAATLLTLLVRQPFLVVLGSVGSVALALAIGG